MNVTIYLDINMTNEQSLKEGQLSINIFLVDGHN